MPGQRHPFERGGPVRIELSWGLGWRNFTVRLDGKEVGTVTGGMGALKQGQTFALPDGSTLGLKLVQNNLSTLPDLQVTRNGQLLPGTGADPEIKLRNTYQIIYFIAGLNILLGVIAELGNVEFLQNLGLGWFSAGFGAVYALLGYFVQQRSLIALIIAIGLFALDGILSLIVATEISGTPPLAGIFVRFGLLAILAQGIGAIRTLKNEV